jgi:hypothetical protein
MDRTDLEKAGVLEGGSAKEVLASLLSDPDVSPALRRSLLDGLLEGEADSELLSSLARNPSLGAKEAALLIEASLPRREMEEVLLSLLANPEAPLKEEAYRRFLGMYSLHVYSLHVGPEEDPDGAFLSDKAVHKLTEAILKNDSFPSSSVEHLMEVLEKRALVRLEAMEILQAYAQDPVYGGNYKSFYADYEKSVALTVEALEALVDHPSLQEDQVRRGKEALARILEQAGGESHLQSVLSSASPQAR